MSVPRVLTGLPASQLIRVGLLERALLQVPMPGGERWQFVSVDVPDMAGMTSRDLFAVTGRCAVSPFVLVGETGITGGSFGSNLVVNGDFNGNADGWTLEAGWTYDGNKITHAAVNGPTDAYQEDGGAAPDGQYRMSFDITGTGYVNLTVMGSLVSTWSASDGPHFETLATISRSGSRIVQLAPYFIQLDGSIANVVVQPVTAALIQVGTVDGSMWVDNVTQSPLAPGTLRDANGRTTETNQLEPAFTYLSNTSVGLTVTGEISAGSMTATAIWFPLEDGATVTAI